MAEDGNRRRYYSERIDLEDRQRRGDPIVFDQLSEQFRLKLAQWVLQEIIPDAAHHEHVAQRAGRVLGREWVADGTTRSEQIRNFLAAGSPASLWSIVEIAVDVAFERRIRTPAFRQKLRDFNVFLGDEYVGYRLELAGKVGHEKGVIRRIDSALLHREVVDRTFDITAHPDFASANTDYADAWRAYSRRDFDDAITNAGKALESAEKIILRKLNPAADVNLTAAPLAQAVFDAGILPTRLQTFRAQLRTIFQTAVTPVRNAPGVAHGSVTPDPPGGELAMLVLHLTGSLIFFLVSRHQDGARP